MTTFITNPEHGCLEKYARIVQIMDKNAVVDLVKSIDKTPGFLVGYQIPFLFALSSQLGRARMAEIGCWFGRATRTLAAGNPELQLDCVDTFLGSEEHQKELKGKMFQPEFEQNITPYKDRVAIHVGFSDEVAKTFENESLDAVFIDAAHDYENVVKDILAWSPKLKRGGLMLGHDYPHPDDPHGGFEDLRRAVDELVKGGAGFKDFGFYCGIWGAIKHY